MQTKFFTGEGDRGVSRIGNKEVSKANPIVDFLGGLDELNSWIGFCSVEANNFQKTGGLNVLEILKKIQNFLFIAQAETAALGFGLPAQAGHEKSPKITEEKTKYFEAVIAEIDKFVPKIEKFVIVGGTELSGRLDVARAIARRVERQAKKYSPETPDKNLSPALLKFLNRLSSILFALARYVNHAEGIKEEHPSYE